METFDPGKFVLRQLGKQARIRNFFPLITSSLLVVLLFACVLAFILYNAGRELQELHIRHSQVERTSDELRQSSDDLSRYSRLYAVTGEQEYLDIYNAIIGIRNGTVPRPKNYEGVYWDLSPELREQRHPPGEKRPLRDEFDRLMTPEEIAVIEESKIQSDRLSGTLERRAFEAASGGGEEGLAMARDLLHSPEYRKHKQAVMLPLDELSDLIRARLKQEQRDIARYVNIVSALVALTLLLGLGLLIVVVRFSRARILRPVELLTRTMLENKDMPDAMEIGFRNDEIGLLASRFFQMKATMEQNYRELENISFRDPLTGIYNRNYFFQEGDLARKRAARDGSPICVIMADLDHFKSVNDTYGHLIGDEVLKQAAKVIAGNIRETDIVARFGGEEFVVILLNAHLESGAAVAEKIRAETEAAPCGPEGRQFTQTISLGVAEVLKEDEDLNAAISVADKALYAAKEAGRNQIQTSPRHPATTSEPPKESPPNPAA